MVRRQRRRRRRQRHRPGRPRRRRPACARARAASCAPTPAIIGIGVVGLLAWFVVVRGILLMDVSTGFPILTALVLVPVAGAARRRRRPTGAGPSSCKLSACSPASLTGALSVWLLAAFETGDAGFQFVSTHAWIERVGDLVAPRRRRHLAAARRAHRRAVPARDPRRRPAPRREAVPRLAAAARGRRDGQLPQPRPVRVLHLLRDRARADVLPHRRLGLRRPAVRRPRSSSCSRCSARRSCSSASSPPRSSPATTASARSRSTSS